MQYLRQMCGKQELLVKYKAFYPQIKGWFSEKAVDMLAFFNALQVQQKIEGTIFEIGAYRGKLTLLLATFLCKGERLGVCDIFDDQQLNISGSGTGATLDAFLATMKLLFSDLSFLTVHCKQSSLLTREETGRENRFFSIDGGHSESETFDDMCIARSAIHERGIIILDDFFNTNWPGVKAGVDQYFVHYDDLVPLIYFYNKFLFVHKKSHKYYDDLLTQERLRYMSSQVNCLIGKKELYGCEYLHV